jgi:hypothetical protein
VTPTGSHTTMHLTGTDSFRPDDPSGVCFLGHAALAQEMNLNPSGTGTLHSNFNARLVGSDGTIETGHMLLHVTVAADGTITAFVDAFRVTCG